MPAPSATQSFAPLHQRYTDERPLHERVLEPSPPVAELGGRVPPPRASAEWFLTRGRGA